MTVTTTTNKKVYIANGATTIFGWDFYIPNLNSLNVQLVDTNGVISDVTSGFTVSGVGTATGAVTFATAPANGYKVVLYRRIPYIQDTDLTNQDGFYPEVIEGQMDKGVMQIQQIAEQLNRSLRGPISDTNETMVIPGQQLRAGKYLAFDVNGNPVAVTVNGIAGDTVTGGGTGTGTSGNGGIDIVPTLPGSCTINGSAVYNQADGKLYVCKDGNYVSIYTAFTPNAPAPIEIVTSVPTSCSVNGEPIYNSTTGELLICKDGVYVSLQAGLTPDAPSPVGIGATLPGTASEGDLFLKTADNQIYIYKSGAWVLLSSILAPNAPAAVTVVSTLPGSAVTNAVVLLTTDNKIYRWNGTAWSAIAANVSSVDIGANTITSPMIQANAITSEKIAADTITAGNIAAGAIGTSELSAGSVTAVVLGANSVVAGKVQAGAIGTTELSAGSVTANILGANSVIAGKVQAGAIGASEIAANSITTNHIAASNFLLGSGQIADANITTLKIAGNAVTIPTSYNTQATTYGNGTTVTIASISFSLPQAAQVTIDFLANQLYYSISPAPHCTAILYLDGSIIAGVDIGAGLANNVIALGGQRFLSAGSHTASATWLGDNSNIAIGNICLRQLSVMR